MSGPLFSGAEQPFIDKRALLLFIEASTETNLPRVGPLLCSGLAAATDE